MLRPFLHFLWIGAALFAVDRLWLSAPVPDPVVIPAQRVEALRASFRERAGRAPDEEELAALLRSEADDELLRREALALGFDRDDPVIARRLLQNMRFAGADDDSGGERDAASLVEEARDLGMDASDPVVRRRLVQRMRLLIEARALEEEPSEEALRAHYDETLARYRDPARVRITQLYFDGEPEGEAERALASLRAGEGPPDPRSLADPFLHAARQPLQSRRELAGRFGEALAEAAFALAPGVWSEPVRSGYGEHLLRVEERTPESQRPFEAVREEVRLDWLAERRELLLRETLRELREGVAVVVEGGPRLSP